MAEKSTAKKKPARQQMLDALADTEKVVSAKQLANLQQLLAEQSRKTTG